MELKPTSLLRSPLAAWAPPLLLALCIWLWAVDVLNWDEWIIWINLLEKLQGGTLSLADLVAQQNEQRNLAARLFGLLLLPTFGLNRLAECALNIALAGGMFLLVRRLYAQTAQTTSPPAPTLAISLLCFSLLQWETFSVGINSSVLLPPLAMWAGTVLVSGRVLTWTRLTGAILVGVMPSFSFVNGLFYWLCLTPLIALRAGTWGQRLIKTSVFSLAGALAWVAYFHGYTRPPHHPTPFIAFTHPQNLGSYFLAYLGGALVGDKNLLPLAILAGCAALVLLWIYLRPLLLHMLHNDWRWSLVELDRLAPWLAVAAFTLLSALATSIGRSSFGLAQALESRYATFSTPFWLVLVSLNALRGHSLTEQERLWTRRILVGCLTLFLLSSVLSAIVLRNRAQKLAEAQAEIFRCTSPQKLEALFPDPAYVVIKLPILLKQRVAMFRDIKPLDAYNLSKQAFGNFEIQPTVGVSGRVCGYLATGEVPSRQPCLVLLALPERVAAVAKADSNGHFSLFFPDNALPTGDCTLRALALDKDGHTLHPLGSASEIHLTNTPCPPPTLRLEKYFHVR